MEQKRPYQKDILAALKAAGYIVEFHCEDGSAFCAVPWTLTLEDTAKGTSIFYRTKRLETLQDILEEVPPEDTPLMLVQLQDIWYDPPDESTELSISPSVLKYLLQRGGYWDRKHLHLLISVMRLRLEGLI